MPWTDANGVSLRYQQHGQGRQLVLLHEMGGCLESWERTVPLLAEQFRILSFDMRGAGMSEKHRSGFSIDDLAGDVTGLLDVLDLREPTILAGCAVGAAVALHVAAVMPARIAGVVAMSPATSIAADKKAATLELADQLETEGVRSRVEQRFDQSYPPRYFENAAQRAAVRGRLLSIDPHGYAATYRMLAGLDMDADFEKIQCPVLVIAGMHDGTRPPAVVEKIAQAIAGAEFRTIDSGHAMNILSPGAVAAAIVEFSSRPP